ncbi:hypothetical protein TWF718_009907 [Orbilia javanica]|uniref:F-box domain-containing protein n=1 Tax=Orbilia javanica TaxID=47235 RepID=A0AAN8RBT0_9PEZI
MSLSTIPNELLSQILSHASPSGTRYNCLLVNRRFYSLMLPIVYRDLQVPFIGHNRLVTLIRTVRRNEFLKTYTKTLCLGEDPFDNKRSVERIIGSNDINKLFPFLNKIELFAMTFERTMLYRFWAYCARATGLTEVVLHYPDLVPLVQPVKGLKKLTWSFTGCETSPILSLPGGVVETKWIANKWLKSLEGCLPELESLVIGCVGREGTWGISDRIGLEVEEAEIYRKVEFELPKFEKLREFEWKESEGIAPVVVWWDTAQNVMQAHKDQLERVRWEVAMCGGRTHSAESHGSMFSDGVKDMKNLKKLELALYPGSSEPLEPGEPENENSWSMQNYFSESSIFISKAEDWVPKGLEEFKIRFSIIGSDPMLEKEILEKLGKLNYLRALEMTFGVPYYDDASDPEGEGKKEFRYWYHDVKLMTDVINALPISLEKLVINFDGKHDTYDRYRQYEFEPIEDTTDEWDEDGSIRAQIKGIVNQRRSIPKKLLYDRMPNLKEIYIGGYDLVNDAEEVAGGMAGLSLDHQ